MTKQLFFLTAIVCLFSQANLFAQDDDMYFVPKKKTAEEKAKEAEMKRNWNAVGSTYYIGSKRSVDEYNRRGKFESYFEKVGEDSIGNDIIEFHVGNGQYPDSLSMLADTVADYSINYNEDDDYQCSRNLSRWDGYYSPCYAGHYYGPWGYYSYAWDPWYWDTWYWNDPWYWDDPWYWHSGWYGPYWYRPGWGGWYGPRWSAPIGPVIVYSGGGTRTYSHGRIRNGRTSSNDFAFTGRSSSTNNTSRIGSTRSITRGIASDSRSTTSAIRRNNLANNSINTTRRYNANNTINNQNVYNRSSNTNFSSSTNTFSNAGSFSGASRGGGFSGGGGFHTSGGGAVHYGGRR